MGWEDIHFYHRLTKKKKKNSACNKFIIKKAAKMSEREKEIDLITIIYPLNSKII